MCLLASGPRPSCGGSARRRPTSARPSSPALQYDDRRDAEDAKHGLDRSVIGGSEVQCQYAMRGRRRPEHRLGGGGGGYGGGGYGGGGYGGGGGGGGGGYGGGGYGGGRGRYGGGRSRRCELLRAVCGRLCFCSMMP